MSIAATEAGKKLSPLILAQKHTFPLPPMSVGRNNGTCFCDTYRVSVLDLDNICSFQIGIFKNERGSTLFQNLLNLYVLPPCGYLRTDQDRTEILTILGGSNSVDVILRSLPKDQSRITCISLNDVKRLSAESPVCRNRHQRSSQAAFICVPRSNGGA